MGATQTYLAENVRIKREYLVFVREAKRYSPATVDAVAKAIQRFEEFTKYRSFRAFHIHQAIAFKAYLAQQRNGATSQPLSKATMNATLGQLKAFFVWLAGKPGYKSRISYSDGEYFNLSEKEARVATARRERAGPTLEQVKQVLRVMPTTTDLERRNQAVVAFTLLTGSRDSALASFKLKHLDLDEGCVFQDAREVKTKNSKTFTTYFFPVGGEAELIVRRWAAFLRVERLWGEDDPLFPATEMALGATRQFQAVGISRTHWTTTTPIRGIFKSAFAAAGLPYSNPHSIRKTLVRLGQVCCRTPEDFKAWSQNLGHEKVLTTFMSYGSVASDRQRDLLRNLTGRSISPAFDEKLNRLVQLVAREIQASPGHPGQTQLQGGED